MNNQQRLINIVVTGVGKTSFSALLSDRLNDHLHQSQQQNFNFNVLNLGEMINEGHLYTLNGIANSMYLYSMKIWYLTKLSRYQRWSCYYRLSQSWIYP